MDFVDPLKVEEPGGGVELAKRRRQMWHRRLERAGRPDAGAPPDHQVETEVIFEQLYPLTYCRGGDPEFVGGGLQGATAHGELESLQGAKVRGLGHGARLKLRYRSIRISQ
jgi:hypothetical protein